MEARNVIDKHTEKIALKTLKMNPAMCGVMGQTKEEAVKNLRTLGYSDKEIKELNSIS